ncbi:MAG TPA: hypothetical protein VFF11_04680 [Candidatus Binatia bacterium]|nr:hypothetical protein [Candidatus Binatia bacterium]
MKTFLAIIICGATMLTRAEQPTNTVPASSTDASVETIVCIRHGEKPPGGLGQLTCRGLNRALALPKVLLAKYGRPQFIFAPNPMHKVDGNRYYYVRPLATIEPTAIRCGLPVNTAFGYDEIKGLENELKKPKYENATIFMAWEHGLLDDFARQMVKHHGGEPKTVPPWPGSDYDTIFVFKITKKKDGQELFQFTISHEGLNNLSDECP